MTLILFLFKSNSRVKRVENAAFAAIINEQKEEDPS